MSASSASSVGTTSSITSVFDSASTVGSSTTGSTTFDPSQASSRPIPSQTRGVGGGGGPQLVSPAASNLYLYTFLATLALLLLVSGAVIVRSIRLRVRARRVIEESIRNGTYVPPPRGFNGSTAQKPAFHDAYLKDPDVSALMNEKHGRWETFVPVAASFVPSKSVRPLPRPATSPPPRTRDTLRTHLRNFNPFRTVQLQDILDELASRDLHSRMVIQETPAPTQAELAAVAFRAPVSNDDGNPDQEQIERPSAVRVAVLIAMPDPAHPTSINSQDDASSSTSSAKGKTSARVTDVVKSDDEAEMPYVEFGIAEVPFAPSASQLSPSSTVPPSVSV